MDDARRLVNKVGPVVEGEEFWDRKDEVARFLELIEEGHHLLLVAPRRVGKTSLLREALRRLHDRGEDYGLFVDLQGCASAEDAIVALSMATRSHRKIWKKTLDVFKSVLGSIADRIDSVGSDIVELKLREGTAEAWRQRGDRILENLARTDRPVVVCLDELPVMLMRLMRAGGSDLSEEGVKGADLFLSWLRRACTEHQGRIRFVVCGSIGLEPVVHRAGLSHTIAQLRPYSLGPWDRQTGDECLAALARNYGLSLSDPVRADILSRLGWLVPHHVQMYFGHILDDCRRRKLHTVSVEDAQRVYAQCVLGARGQAVLADYEERLRRVLGPDLTPLAIDLLTEAAVVRRLTASAAATLAVSTSPPDHDPSASLRAVMDVLVHDGYLVAQEDAEHVFVPGLVRDWWRRRFGEGYVRAEERGG